MDAKSLPLREQKIQLPDGRVMTVEEAYEWVCGDHCCEFCKHNVNEIGGMNYCDINVRGTLIDYDIFGEKVNLMPTLSNCKKYEPAKRPWFLEKRYAMHKYIKIETPFNRDMDGTKKLIEGDWRNETVKCLANSIWECTEKIDGTNIGIVWDGHKVSYQGRTERAQIPAHLMNKLIEMFGGETNEELFEQKFGEMPVILFGEGYGAKIQNGGNYRQDVSFILFDVYLPENDIWLKRDSVEGIAQAFGIDVVPVVLTGTLQNAIDFVKNKPKSTIGTAMMEGLVCRPAVELRDRMGHRVIVKIKVRDFA